MVYKINPLNIKAIALDLDGTLLNEEHKISSVNKKAKALKETLVIAPANSDDGVGQVLNELFLK